jgi:hypothetical protein
MKRITAVLVGLVVAAASLGAAGGPVLSDRPTGINAL